jgi:hypothetical protein
LLASSEKLQCRLPHGSRLGQALSSLREWFVVSIHREEGTHPCVCNYKEWFVWKKFWCLHESFSTVVR